jgi:hypothetical protein
MKTIGGASIAALVLVLTACSQGAEGDPFPSWPPPGGPGVASATDGQATFGVDSEGETVGSCCLPQDGPGCNDEFVEACVCADVTSCCSDLWTAECAALVDELGCGSCNGGPLDTGGGSDTGEPPTGQDCCIGGPDPSCNDATVEACVCAEIPFCCDTGWEEVCASAVGALSCGHCGGGVDTGEPPPGDTGEPSGDTGEPPGDTGEPPPEAGECCTDNGTPGCTDPAVQDCVCMQDAYCCDTAWDQVCVDEVASFMCGDCGGGMMPPGASSCCSAQMGPGCDDPMIADCVCAIDDFCCSTQWDATCAIFVALFACGTCS